MPFFFLFRVGFFSLLAVRVCIFLWNGCLAGFYVLILLQVPQLVSSGALRKIGWGKILPNKKAVVLCTDCLWETGDPLHKARENHQLTQPSLGFCSWLALQLADVTSVFFYSGKSWRPWACWHRKNLLNQERCLGVSRLLTSVGVSGNAMRENYGWSCLEAG